MVRLKLFLTFMLYSVFVFSVNSNVLFIDTNEELALTEHAQFAISNTSVLTGRENWVDDPISLDRKPTQYLHFKIEVKSKSSRPTPVWFNITFPAIKHLQVSDGRQVWNTGDALPFSTREINLPNYHFPSILPANDSVTFTGHMRGEILRYNFSLATPEKVINDYVDTLQRDMAFFGAMAILTALSFLVFFATRKIAFLSFAVFIFATTFWFFRVFGYAFEILWPQTPELNDISYAVSIYALLLSAFGVIVTVLKRPGRQIYGEKFIKWFCYLLPLIGIAVWQTLGLDLALRLPVLLFFPYLIISVVVIIVEHKRGSDIAKRFAIAMLPIAVSSLFLVIIALNNTLSTWDPVATFMAGILLTCVFMIVITSNYLIRRLQKERDAEKEVALMKSEQTSLLESLVKERTLELEQSNRMLAELASKDALTNLPNRRSVDLFVDASFEGLVDGDRNIAIALIDLDHFKTINDNFGHDVGDIVLKKVANTLAAFNSENILAGRFGGEEFAIIARDMDDNTFYKMLNTIHDDINELSLTELGDRTVGASIGFTMCTGQTDVVDAFRRADKALYIAKNKGRNCIVRAKKGE
jgi:diguanylate cyclase (GGDEF)-like protein